MNKVPKEGFLPPSFFGLNAYPLLYKLIYSMIYLSKERMEWSYEMPTLWPCNGRRKIL